MSLTNSHFTSIEKKLEQIHTIWKALQTNWLIQTIKDLHRLAHQLSRLCDVKELTELVLIVKRLEQYLFSMLEYPARPKDSLLNQVESCLQELDQLILELATTLKEIQNDLTDASNSRDNHNKFQSLVETYSRSDQHNVEAELNHKVGVIDQDQTRAKNLAEQLLLFGYEAEVFDYLPGLDELKYNLGLNAAIIDLELTQNTPGYEISAIEGTATVLPLIFLSTKSEVSDRLQAVKNGGRAFFARPPQIRELVDQLDNLTTSFLTNAYRILIVDDSRSSVAFYSNVLQKAGMLTRVVTDPLQIIQPLIEFVPDLILMDMHMPGCTGLELAAVIRQQSQYVSVPIVFLSAETNLQTQLRAYQLGGDDFLTKPIQAEHLVSLVSSRSERHRILRSFIEQDSLTGLLNQARLRERLALEVARARRLGSNLAFAMLDIDHFKSVNDTYGHPVGDRVIKNLARLLLQRLRRTDIVGRYGGEEFAILLPDTTKENALKVLDDLREKFAQFRQYGEGLTFFITISGGIATFPEHSEINSLCNVADKALYRAKRGGRNRIETE